MFAAVYQDEGPRDQPCLNTDRWLEVHLCETEAQALALTRIIGPRNYRRRPRWTLASTDENDGHHKLVDHCK